MKKTMVFALLAMASAMFAEGFKIEFSPFKFDKNEGTPKDWFLRGKPFVNKPTYTIVKDEKSGKNVLHINCDDGTGAIVFQGVTNLLKKYPVIRWKWRMVKYPAGADARDKDKDDQAIALYAGFGRVSSKSVAYRWETETPKGSTGDALYSMGLVEVKWFALRDKTDGTDWKIEERNVAKDIIDTYGSLPDETSISISTNSQYTGTKCAAELEYIEFLPGPSVEEKK